MAGRFNTTCYIGLHAEFRWYRRLVKQLLGRLIYGAPATLTLLPVGRGGGVGAMIVLTTATSQMWASLGSVTDSSLTG